MASSSADQEELLLALMSMGFEYENCRKVIDGGITVLEDAVQRLMNPDSEPSSQPSPQQATTTVTTPSNVEPTQSSSIFSQQFSQQPSEESSKVKSRYERQRKEQEEFEKSEFKQAELLRKKQRLEDRKLKQNILKEIKSDRKQHFKLTDDNQSSSTSNDQQSEKDRKRKEREEYEAKQKEKRAEDWKRVQAEKRKERQRVLTQIENDKQSKKHRAASPPHQGISDGTLTVDDGQTPTSSNVKTSPEKKTTCRIQVNFPDRSSQNYTLPVDSTLENLNHICSEHLSTTGDNVKYSFVQTFPRKTFTEDHYTKTLQELGLCPSCRLILQPYQQPSSNEQNSDSPNITASQPQNASGLNETPNQQSPNPEEPSIELLSPESQAVGQAEEPMVATPAVRPCLGSRLLQGDLDNHIEDDAMMDVGNPSDDEEPDEDIANPDLIQQAIQRRLTEQAQEGNHDYHASSRRITSLQKSSAVFIAQQLIKKEKHIVENIQYLNSTTADLIIKALQRSNNLTTELLNILQPCKLKEINLDFCRLASVDLLYALKSHQNLRRISLKSVTCVSDRLVETLVKNIPRITYLNLSDCEAIVGSFLTATRGLSRLKSLNLSRTKLKDEYTRNFLRMAIAKDLEELSLNRCNITNAALDLEEDFPSITALSVDESKVTSLSFLEKMSNLRSLSVKKTSISDNDMTFVAALKHLHALELHSTHITHEGLSHLHAKRLVRFSFPDRMYVTNESIKVIEDFPLTALDLTNFVHLDDGCIPSIRKVKSLKHLYLTQLSKITDNGVIQLKVLRDLETLNLRHTNVTSSITPIFEALRLLHTLDLTGTKIDNELLTSLSLCLNLVKLNLSHTRIDDEGLITLNAPRLSILTLDGTDVTMQAVNRLLLKCTSLSWVRNASKNVLYERESMDET
eukprot:TCONS_00011650-protein